MPRIIGLLFLACVGACASTAAPRLSYEGRSTIVATNPLVVDAVVTVRNTGSTTANLTTPHCPLWVAVYATAKRDAEPLFKSGSDSCISNLMIYPPIVIAPGDYFDFIVRATLPTFRGMGPVYLSMTVPQVQPIGAGQLVPVGQLGAWREAFSKVCRGC